MKWLELIGRGMVVFIVLHMAQHLFKHTYHFGQFNIWKWLITTIILLWAVLPVIDKNKSRRKKQK